MPKIEAWNQSVGVTSAEQNALGEFWQVVEEVRPELDAAVEAAARNVPAFAALLATLDREAQAEQSVRARALERAALCDGDWRPYLDDLSTQGVGYAEAGISFGDWYALLSPYREVLYDRLIPGESSRERRVLTGMSKFLDIAMATIADAYISTKEALVRQAEAQRDLYARVFTESSLGKMIFEWMEPPDLGSFRLVALNAAAQAHGSGEIDDLVGKTLRSAFPHILERGIAEHFAAAVERGETPTWEVQHAVPGQPEQFYDARCYSLGGRFVGVIFADVSDRKKMEQQIERHVRELERSNRELDDFAYVASHDLKSPLRDIDTLAGWIEEDAAGALPAESRRHMRRLRDRIGRMERLLDDLLQYSRAGRVSAPVEEISPRDVAEDVVALMTPPVGFAIQVNGDAPRIRSPRAPLEQVLRNLIANAIKHHHRDHGRIDVTISELSPREIKVEVGDDGPGIPPEFRERVFRMFQTLRPRDEVEGSGMGLAIVKKLVEAHGGRVWIEAAAATGTVIHFTWPRRSSV